MKRFLSLLLAAVLLLALAACGGNVKDVQTKAVASEMYTQNDIDAAIDVIKKDFSRSWKGCTLTEISYAGDDVSREHQDWAALEQSTGDMLAQAQKSLAAAEEALTAVNDAAEKLDVEGLNTAVTELLAVMQPLAEFFARFK